MHARSTAACGGPQHWILFTGDAYTHNVQFSRHVNARSVHSILFAERVNTSVALKGLRNFKTATWTNIQIAMNTLQYVQSRN